MDNLDILDRIKSYFSRGDNEMIIEPGHGDEYQRYNNYNVAKGQGNTKGRGVIKENPALINVSYKGINNINSNNNPNKPNSIKGIKWTCFDNTLSVEQNITNMRKRYNEILNKGNKNKSGIKNHWGRKMNPDRIKRDKEDLGIKYTKLSLNFLGANCM